MRRTLAIIGLTLLFAAPWAIAAGLKTWSNSEVMLPTDINSNFSHIHNTMVGAHGARLVNADVSASALISHTKLATPGLLPKAWMSNGIGPACTTSPCSIAQQWPAGFFSSVTRPDAGYYAVNIASARANAAYFPLMDDTGPGDVDVNCRVQAGNTTSLFYVQCIKEGSADPTDSTFSILFFDDNN